MPSPFPGLDPYLEAHWRDVHTCLMVYASDAMQGELPDDLFARVVEELVGDAGHEFWTDEPVTKRHIEIRDQSSGGRIVTAIEIFCPTDKNSVESRARHKQNQREYRHEGVNLVEIDLVRSGQHTISLPARSIPKDRRTGLYACIRRADSLGLAHVYDIPLNQRLPAIWIPLRPTDKDIQLDLQALFSQAYDRGRYAATIDYTEDPDPPLPPHASRWADELLRGAGKRE